MEVPLRHRRRPRRWCIAPNCHLAVAVAVVVLVSSSSGGGNGLIASWGEVEIVEEEWKPLPPKFGGCSV